MLRPRRPHPAAQHKSIASGNAAFTRHIELCDGPGRALRVPPYSSYFTLQPYGSVELTATSSPAASEVSAAST